MDLRRLPQAVRTAEAMTPTPPKISSRLARAATAELTELDRQRALILKRRSAVQAELEDLDKALGGVDERVALLKRIAPVEENLAGELVDESGALPAVDLPAGKVLRGTAIRETAARLLAESPDATRPVHYRRLYGLLTESGYSVTGKDPLATFLTQLSRSPVMHKTTQAGVYELDRESPGRLRDQLSMLHTELRAATENPGPTGDLGEIRQRRGAVLSEITRVERALEEVARVLGQVGSAEHLERGAA